jgi:hypothetical protein
MGIICGSIHQLHENNKKAYSRILSTIDNDYKFLNVLAAKGLFIPPKKITIKSSVTQSNKKGMPDLKVIQTTS